MSIVVFTSSIDSRMKLESSLMIESVMPGRQLLLDLLDGREHAVGDGHRVGAGLLLDLEGQSRPLVEEGGVLRLLDAVDDLRHVAHVDRHAAGALDRDLARCRRPAAARGHAHQGFGRPAVGGAGRDLDVLALEGRDDLGQRDVVGLELRVDDHLDLARRLADERH